MFLDFFLNFFFISLLILNYATDKFGRKIKEETKIRVETCFSSGTIFWFRFVSIDELVILWEKRQARYRCRHRRPRTLFSNIYSIARKKSLTYTHMEFSGAAMIEGERKQTKSEIQMARALSGVCVNRWQRRESQTSGTNESLSIRFLKKKIDMHKSLKKERENFRVGCC